MSPACYRHFAGVCNQVREPIRRVDDAARHVFEWIMSAPDLPAFR